MRMFKVTRGTQDCWGIAINYNPDFRDVSFHFLKWYIAIGFKQKLVPFEKVLSEIEWTDEDSWYLHAEYNCCELCDDFLVKEDPIALVDTDDEDYVVICEYCLNPDLKDE